MGYFKTMAIVIAAILLAIMLKPILRFFSENFDRWCANRERICERELLESKERAERYIQKELEEQSREEERLRQREAEERIRQEEADERRRQEELEAHRRELERQRVLKAEKLDRELIEKHSWSAVVMALILQLVFAGIAAVIATVFFELNISIYGDFATDAFLIVVSAHALATKFALDEYPNAESRLVVNRLTIMTAIFVVIYSVYWNDLKPDVDYIPIALVTVVNCCVVYLGAWIGAVSRTRTL